MTQKHFKIIIILSLFVFIFLISILVSQKIFKISPIISKTEQKKEAIEEKKEETVPTEKVEKEDCEKISDNKKRDECILKLSIEKENPEICNKSTIPKRCLYKFALKKGEEGKCEICESIKEEVGKNICMLQAASKNNFKSFCKNIGLENFLNKYEYRDLGFYLFAPTLKLIPMLDFSLTKLTQPAKSINLYVSLPERKIVKDSKNGLIALTYLPIIPGGHIHESYLPTGGPSYQRKSYLYFDQNDKKCKLYLVEETYEEHFGEINGIPLETDVLEQENLPINEENLKKYFPSGKFVEPKFYTVGGLPVFDLWIRFGHINFVCIPPSSFLMVQTVNPMGDGQFADGALDPITKTIAKIDSKVDKKTLEQAFIDILMATVNLTKTTIEDFFEVFW